MNGDGTPGPMDVFQSILGGIVNWLRMPFDTQGSALNWFLFLGLIIIFAGLWNFILIDMVRE